MKKAIRMDINIEVSLGIVEYLPQKVGKKATGYVSSSPKTQNE
jgi:hypothetical protein